MQYLLRHHIHDALGARDQRCPLGVPVDPGMPLEHQRLARDEVGNQQTDAGIQLDIAQGVEEAIAGKIGKRQAAVGIQVQKAWPAATMRDIHAVGRSIVQLTCAGRDEEGVRLGQQGARLFIAPCRLVIECHLAADQRFRLLGSPVDLTLLDVLRTVAEALIDPDPQPIGRHARHRFRGKQGAIQAIAPPTGQIQPQHADPGTGSEIQPQQFPQRRSCMHLQLSGRGIAKLPGRRKAHHRPRPAVAVRHAHEQHRQTREERDMLLRHPVAHVGGDLLEIMLRHACACLDTSLTCMKYLPMLIHGQTLRMTVGLRPVPGSSPCPRSPPRLRYAQASHEWRDMGSG